MTLATVQQNYIIHIITVESHDDDMMEQLQSEAETQ